MTVRADVMLAMAEVYDAGAKYVRGFVLNNDAQREGETLAVMAAKAREIAGRDDDE